MRKRLVVLFILIICLGLAGCGTKEPSYVEEISEQEEAIEELEKEDEEEFVKEDEEEFAKEDTKNTVSEDEKNIIRERYIFLVKDKTPSVYTDLSSDIENFVAYRDNWKFGDILNEEYFKEGTITWQYIDTKQETPLKLIAFGGYTLEKGDFLVLTFAVGKDVCDLVGFSYPAEGGETVTIDAFEMMREADNEKDSLTALASCEVSISILSSTMITGFSAMQDENIELSSTTEEIIYPSFESMLDGRTTTLDSSLGYSFECPTQFYEKLYNVGSRFYYDTYMWDTVGAVGQVFKAKNEEVEKLKDDSEDFVVLARSNEYTYFMRMAKASDEYKNDYRAKYRNEYYAGLKKCLQNSFRLVDNWERNQENDLISGYTLYVDTNNDVYDFVLLDTDKRVISVDEVMKLNKEELHLARNEIYAKHGRKFKDEAIQAYFDSKSWYHGNIEPEDFSEDVLNDIEKANIQLLKDYESNYDSSH